MRGFEKYTRQYFLPESPSMDWAKKSYVDKAPIWCSVDLRDGNQALVVPMGLRDKLEFFKMLVNIGFKEIEIGFPAASDTEFQFCRTLIEGGYIPDDVTIQVITQAREHIIARTFEAIRGAKNAIVHMYNSTSLAQRQQVFHKTQEEIIQIAQSGAESCLRHRDSTDGTFRFEYSPESFTGTEPDFALRVCNTVTQIWRPSADDKVIIDLPVTVAHSMPHIYASQVEYMCRNLKGRENLIVSVHPHNDRGCAVADAEMGLLAGADRVEGTLFGNGERTGNVDIVTLALNMYSQGVDPKLDLSNIPAITEIYERATRMHVYERQPYSGQLVFAAFSGSHQDAIAKGMKWRGDHPGQLWTVPYLPIDPRDIGREYDADVIRINSQSGKGGIGFILEHSYSHILPPKMREDFSYHVKRISDKIHRELHSDDIYEIFTRDYVNITSPLAVPESHFRQTPQGITATCSIELDGSLKEVEASGNGRLDAVSNAIIKTIGPIYTLDTYTEHALEVNSSAKAASYVAIQDENGDLTWGAGISSDIIVSSIRALVSAVNRLLSKKERQSSRSTR